MALVGVRRALLGGAPRPVFDFDFRTAPALPPAVTFTRASALNDFGANGLLTQFGSGVPAFPCFDPLTGRNRGMGFWIQSNIGNRWPRDLTNAHWIATSITAAKNQTGIDGAANAASSITATANGGTIFQTADTSNIPHEFSAWVKRLTGTGTVSMTLDGGSTYTDVTAEINSSTWTRVASGSTAYPVGGGIWQNNSPVMGFMLGTSGDSVAVDYANMEGINAGGAVTFIGPSPPVDTGNNFNITRNTDLLTLPLSAIPGLNPDRFTMVVRFMIPYWLLLGSPGFTAGTGLLPLDCGIAEIDDGTANNALFLRLQKGDINSNYGTDVNWSTTLGGSTPSGVGKVRATKTPGPATELGGLLPMQAGAFAGVAVGYDVESGMGISAVDGLGGGPTPEQPDLQPGFTPGKFTRLVLGGTTNVNAGNLYVQRLTLYAGRLQGGALQQVLEQRL